MTMSCLLFFNIVDKKMDSVVQFSRQTLKKKHIFKPYLGDSVKALENSVKPTAHTLVCYNLLLSLLPCQDNSRLKTTM